MSHGAVAAGHPLSARAGAEALASGGNAFDAALAATFTGAVCEAALTSPAAGGFLLARPAGQAPTLLDFFVAAPGLGPRGRRLDPDELDNFVVPFGGAEQVFHHGVASVAVPGMVVGLLEIHRRWCRMPLSDLVAFAAAAAREGVTITPKAAYLNEILRDMLRATPECAAIHAPAERVLAEGEVLRNPDLADTLETIARDGVAPLNAAIASHQRAEGGHVTGDDLSAYRAIERRPLVVGVGAGTLHGNPPPSSGGVLIAAALRRVQAESRGGHYLRACVAGSYANALRGEVFERLLHEADAPPPDSRKPTGSTTHVSAIDAEGNVAALSSSNGSSSGVVVPGTGVLLNNIMGEQDLNPGGFGLVPPGRRMTSMMSPSVLLDGERQVALGAAGSNRLRSAILQTVMNVVEHGMTPAEAVARPRIHPEGEGVDVEGGVPDDAIHELERSGYALRRWSDLNLFFGGVNLVSREGDRFDGAGDPRRGGHAALADARGEVHEL